MINQSAYRCCRRGPGTLYMGGQLRILTAFFRRSFMFMQTRSVGEFSFILTSKPDLFSFMNFLSPYSARPYTCVNYISTYVVIKPRAGPTIIKSSPKRYSNRTRTRTRIGAHTNKNCIGNNLSPAGRTSSATSVPPIKKLPHTVTVRSLLYSQLQFIPMQLRTEYHFG